MTEPKEFDWTVDWFYETRAGRPVRCLYVYDNGEACMCDFELDLAYLVDKHGKTIRTNADRDIVAGPHATCDEDDLDQIKADCEEFDLLSKEVEAEREQWEYGHASGILDALESLLSFRENMQGDVLLAMIQKVTKRKLFEPPF